jgi:hypothetical protein
MTFVKAATFYQKPILAKRDGTKPLIKDTKPPTDKELEADKEYNYYHPAVISGYSSGNTAEDIVYNHPWLMNLPIIGKAIKNRAYEIASNSGGGNTVDDLTRKQGKYTGQDMNEMDGQKSPNLVDQYFGKGNLPKSTYTPTSDYLPFLPSYSIKGDFDKRHSKKGYDMTPVLQDIARTKVPEQVNDIDFTKPLYKTSMESSALSEALDADLGSHKVGISYDPVRKLPYASISDAWDFEPNGYANRFNGGENKQAAYVQASLMQQAGKPFKVYDRFYFDPKTKQYIPDDKLPPVNNTPSPIVSAANSIRQPPIK